VRECGTLAASPNPDSGRTASKNLDSCAWISNRHTAGGDWQSCSRRWDWRRRPRRWWLKSRGAGSLSGVFFLARSAPTLLTTSHWRNQRSLGARVGHDMTSSVPARQKPKAKKKAAGCPLRLERSMRRAEDGVQKNLLVLPRARRTMLRRALREVRASRPARRFHRLPARLLSCRPRFSRYVCSRAATCHVCDAKTADSRRAVAPGVSVGLRPSPRTRNEGPDGGMDVSWTNAGVRAFCKLGPSPQEANIAASPHVKICLAPFDARHSNFADLGSPGFLSFPFPFSSPSPSPPLLPLQRRPFVLRLHMYVPGGLGRNAIICHHPRLCLATMMGTYVSIGATGRSNRPSSVSFLLSLWWLDNGSSQGLLRKRAKMRRCVPARAMRGQRSTVHGPRSTVPHEKDSGGPASAPLASSFPSPFHRPPQRSRTASRRALSYLPILLAHPPPPPPSPPPPSAFLVASLLSPPPDPRLPLGRTEKIQKRPHPAAVV